MKKQVGKVSQAARDRAHERKALPIVMKRATEDTTGSARIAISQDPLDHWFQLPPSQTGDERFEAIMIAAEQQSFRPIKHEIERVTEFKFTILYGAGKEAPYIGTSGALVQPDKWGVRETHDWTVMSEGEARCKVDELMSEPQRQYRSGLLMQHEYRVKVERRVTVHEDVSCFFQNAHLNTEE